jgi:hypothetical protein
VARQQVGAYHDVRPGARPLEWVARRGFLSRVTESQVGAGVRVGTVAAAATIGAVMGLGLRHGLALRPFMSAGRALLARLGAEAPTGAVAALVGVALVAFAIVVLGVCFTFVAAPLRGVRLLAVAIVFAAIGWAVSLYVVPAILVLSAGTVLGTAQRIFVCALLAVGLVVGMRLARVGTRVE